MQRVYDPNNPLLITSEILLGCREAAAEQGIDLTSSLASCGIAASLLESPKGLLPFHKVVNFLEDVAAQFDCPQFGFLVGKHRPPLRFGSPAQASKLCSDLNAAINNGLRYSLLNSEESLWQLKCNEGYAFLTRHSRVSYEGSLVQLHTLAVTLVFKALFTLSGGRLQPSFISFAHAKPVASKLYSRFFEFPVHFDQDFDGIVFPEHNLQLPIKTADPELLEIVQSHLESVNSGYALNDDIPTKVYHHIRKNLGTTICNIESIAQLLGQHPRTLQNVLKNAGVSFRQLLLDVRQEVAEHYLCSSNISLTDLSDILGYRNVSAFSRAFRKNCGVSPAQWRQQNQPSLESPP